MNTDRGLWAGLLIALGWLGALLFGRTYNIWLLTGVTGALALLGAWACCRRTWGPLLAPRAQPALIGVALGLAMAGATHLLYPLGRAIVPGLSGEVIRLYGQLATPPGPVRALPVLVLVVAAEEVVFRGLVLGALLRWGPLRAVIGSALVYALPQVGTGSPLLVGLALVCGLFWGLERVRTRGLWAPLLTHLLWDVLVFVAFPLERP